MVHQIFLLATAVRLFMVLDPTTVMVCQSFSPNLPLPQLSPPCADPSSTALWMGKGFNKFKNKGQAGLQRKLELAKQQQKNPDEAGDDVADDETPKALTAEQIKERNDRKRFEQLLQREGSKSLNNYNSDGYLSRDQEEEEITAARAYNI